MPSVPDFAVAAASKVNNQPLKVIVMGPGLESTGGPKRRILGEFISTLPAGDEVLFPEDAILGTDHFVGLDEHQAERVLVAEADAVIVLLVNDIWVTGPNTELAQFLQLRSRSKFFVLEPQEFTTLMNNGSPYQLSALRDLDSRRRFSYTEEQLESCTAIRDRIGTWLRGIRYEKLVRTDSI